jgi:hypothetical protein
MDPSIVSEQSDGVDVFASRFAVAGEEGHIPTGSTKIGADDTGTYRKDTEDADT